MAYVYVLQSVKNGRYYIGSSNDLERRLLEHNSGKTASIKYLLPVKLVFNKKCLSLQDARKLELKLKKLKSRSILDKIVRDGNIKMGL